MAVRSSNIVAARGMNTFILLSIYLPAQNIQVN